MSETTEGGSISHRRSLRRRSRSPLIERPRAGAKNRQGEKASGHGDVLLHFDHLIGAPMNEERGQETKSTEGKGRPSRCSAEENEQPAAEFGRDHERQ